MRKETIKETDFKNEERPTSRLTQFFDIFKPDIVNPAFAYIFYKLSITFL